LIDLTLSALQKKILRNWVKLFTGSTLGSALGLVATILMTRTIGVADVGIFSVVQTFWRTLFGFLSFQSFQVFIKYGADYRHQKNERSFKALVKICMVADLGMALFGAALGIGLFAAFYAQMHIPQEIVPIGAFGALTMMTMVTGAHTGILCLFDRFHFVAARDVVIGITRIVLNGVALVTGAKLEAFIGIWVATEALGNLMIIVAGFRELRRNGYRNSLSISLREAPDLKPRALIKALFAVNFGTMIRILSEEGDTLLVNQFTGPSGAGLYRIAKNFSGLSYKLAGPLSQSIYPEIARAVSEKNKGDFKKLLFHAGLQGAAIGLSAWLGWLLLGPLVIRLTVGMDYIGSLPLILIITAGYGLAFFGLGFTPSLYAFGKLKQYLVTAIACTTAFFLVSLSLMPSLGAQGSSWDQFACYLTGFLFSASFVRKAYRKADWTSPPLTPTATK
jgi:O-antigen/teichoic acid export membrane protein